MQQKHYMQKGNNPIIKVDLNQWARYRRMGYDFKTEVEFNTQTAGPVEIQVETEKVEPKETVKKTTRHRTMRRKG